MDVLGNATNHFRRQLSGEMRSLEVAEWGDETGPAVIYFKPMTMAQKSEILSLTNDGKLGEALAETLIQRALDKDGNRIFPKTSRRDLMTKVDPDVISDVVMRMNEEPDLGNS